MPIVCFSPGAAKLAEMRARLAMEAVTYSEVGATVAPELPDGYRHDRAVAELGRGARTWSKAQEGLRTWQAHRHARAMVTPADAPLEPGTVVIVTARVGPLHVVAPCRVVYATAEPDRFGFAYGTLPGHPEKGEEAFHVVQAPDGTVRFEVVAFSRPADPMARAAWPVSRAAQARTTRLYLEGMRRYSASA